MNIFRVITNDEHTKDVKLALAEAENFLRNLDWHDFPFEHFEFCPLTTRQVIEKINIWMDAAEKSPRFELTVGKLTYPWYKRPKYSRTVAVHSGDSIYLHYPVCFGSRRDLADLCNTFTHETIHEIGLGHGDDDILKDTKRKLMSAPYYLGSMCEASVRAKLAVGA